MGRIPENFTVLEILGIAVKTEGDAAEFYWNLAKTINNPLVIKKVERLAVEEEQHGETLTKEYKRLSGGEEPVLPKGFQTNVTKDFDPNIAPEKLIAEAMEIEKRAQEFYLEASQRSEDPRGRQVLEYLSRFEGDHYKLLETELEQLKKDPNWFENSEDLFHVGP